MNGNSTISAAPPIVPECKPAQSGFDTFIFFGLVFLFIYILLIPPINDKEE